MKQFVLEFMESIRIAFEQIRAHFMRSFLTAMGVLIGVIAVTLMGTAIKGIDKGFQNSLAMLGTDILYVDKWPWGDNSGTWWNIRNRPDIKSQFAEHLNEIIQDTDDSSLVLAIPSVWRRITVNRKEKTLENVDCEGTNSDYVLTMTTDFQAGRFFSENESLNGANVVILGHDVSKELFPEGNPVGKSIRIRNLNFEVVGVFARQGSFLGLFSFDKRLVLPLGAMRKFSQHDWGTSIIVKLRKDANKSEAVDEVIGAMRRVRGLLPGEKNDFDVNMTEKLEEDLGPMKSGIALAGLFITGLALFVGAIGIMNITFVSVKERTREIGTRRAVGARRRAILMQFLVEAVLICLIGGFLGLTGSFLLTMGIKMMAPAFPLTFSIDLVILAVVASTVTGIASGFAPAYSASRLDPASALRHE